MIYLETHFHCISPRTIVMSVNERFLQLLSSKGNQEPHCYEQRDLRDERA